MGHSTLIHVLHERRSTHPDQIAYRFLGDGENLSQTLTYDQLDKQAQAVAAKLQQWGGLPGERALLFYPPGLEFIVAFLGCLYAGVIAVPAYPPRPHQSLSRGVAIARDSQAMMALTTRSFLTAFASRFSEHLALANLPFFATDDPEISGGIESFSGISVQPQTVAFLQYTSGSTGTPKGVILTHENLLYNQQMIQAAFDHTHQTIFVGWLPLFHDMGLIGNVLQPLYLGIPSTLMPPMKFLEKPFRWLKAISNDQATTSGAPNFAFDLCVKRIKDEQLQSLDLSSWEVAFNGAEPIRTETLEQFAQKFAACGFRREAFYPCYGLAEATLFVAGPSRNKQKKLEKSAEKNPGKWVSCGQSWLGEKIRIVNPELCTPCPDEAIGEIWISGANVAQGYWNLPSETQKTFQAYLADGKSGPFLRTGDLGLIKNNELFVTGRRKDVIIIRGVNHYPQDIELTVEKSHPALRLNGGAAFTVEVNGEERLVIVQEVERTDLLTLKPQQVMGEIRQAVAGEHGLQVYGIILLKPGTLPKTSSGKIMRYACRENFLKGTFKELSL